MREAIVPPRQFRQASPEERKAFQAEEIRRGFDLRTWWLEEMLQTRSPLTERMTLFWHNHFVSSQQKVRYTQLMYEQNVLLRRHAGGNFGELLHAVAKDPAMVIYLDSASNRKGKPNENFAREVMELFTLGEGRYTEHDIREAARAFTGWSHRPGYGRVPCSGQLLHDDGHEDRPRPHRQLRRRRGARHPARPAGDGRVRRREAVARVRLARARPGGGASASPRVFRGARYDDQGRAARDFPVARRSGRRRTAAR